MTKTNVVVPNGGVSFESGRNAYRGSVTVEGVRYRTNRCKTRRAAARELSLLRQKLLVDLTMPKSLRLYKTKNRSSR
jgi:hypothetical protein